VESYTFAESAARTAGRKPEELERLLVERWLFRGALLGLTLAAAILATYLGMQGAGAFWDRAAIGALVGLMFSAAAGAFVLRSRDIRIHRELRRRRAAHRL